MSVRLAAVQHILARSVEFSTILSRLRYTALWYAARTSAMLTIRIASSSQAGRARAGAGGGGGSGWICGLEGGGRVGFCCLCFSWLSWRWRDFRGVGGLRGSGLLRRVG